MKDSDNMMFPPEYYLTLIIDYSFDELIREREKLIRSIKTYEKKVKGGNASEFENCNSPGPDVVYQCELEYLAQIFMFMSAKFNSEYRLWKRNPLEGNNDDSNKSELNEKILYMLDDYEPIDGIAALRFESERALQAIALSEETKKQIIEGKIKIDEAMNL